MLYDDARVTFCAYVADLIHKASPGGALVAQNVDVLQRHRDVQLQKTHGYSAARFARSFEHTLLFLLPHCSPDEVRRVRSLAMNVFEREAAPLDGLDQALDALGQHFFLGIITSCERWVQERRLSAFEFRDRFRASK
jgi:phosphoglycolate phosphatase-like HAD superfamily hydrolase